MRKLLFFHAPWCPPCRMCIREFIEPVERELPERVQRINVQENPFLADRYHITRIPAVLVEVDGRVIRQTPGGFEVKEMLEILKGK